MHKYEVVKKIHKKLDKILEDFIEILLIIKKTDNDMKGLFFAKRRVLNMLVTVLEIYDHLLCLREIYKENEINNTPEEEKQLFIEFLNNF